MMTTAMAVAAAAQQWHQQQDDNGNGNGDNGSNDVDDDQNNGDDNDKNGDDNDYNNDDNDDNNDDGDKDGKDNEDSNFDHEEGNNNKNDDEDDKHNDDNDDNEGRNESRMTTATTSLSTAMIVMTMKTLQWQQWWDDDGQQEAYERCTTHPRQQSTNGDSWGGRRQEGWQLWGVGWQKRVEVEATWWRHLSSTKSLPYQTSAHPRAAKGPEPIPHASWVSGCAIGAMISLCSGPHLEAWMMMVLSVFSLLGSFSNFNFIFNPVVAPTCHRNLHRQPVCHSTRLD